MAVVGSVHGGSLHSKFQTLPPAKIFNSQKRSTLHRRPPSPPIFISTNLSDVNPIHLQDLYSSCNHSCHRFPNISPDGRVEPVDVDKLRIALSHSSVVVSVFARPETVTSLPENLNTGGDWYRRMIPLTPFSGKLVGFGRAVSDNGLTASIYDVMVQTLNKLVAYSSTFQHKVGSITCWHFFSNRWSLCNRSCLYSCNLEIDQDSISKFLESRYLGSLMAVCSCNLLSVTV